MYCIKCGKKLDEKSAFCSECGEKVREISVTPQTKRALIMRYFKSGENAKKIGLLVGGILAIVLIAVLVWNIRIPAYEKPVHHFVNACATGKYSYFEKALPVKYMNSDMRAYIKEYFNDDFLYEMKSSSTKVRKNSTKVVDKSKLKQSELEDLELFYEFWFDIDEVDVAEGYSLKVEFTAVIDGKKETQTTWMDVVKIKGKWYLDMSFLN